MDKASLRRSILETVRGLDPAARARASREIASALIARHGDARAVMLFWPLPEEPDLRPYAEHVLSRGGAVYLPRTNWSARSLEPARVPGWGEGLVEGGHGLREPGPGGEVGKADGLDLIVVPGVAFDAGCGRLGRGGGFYDRLLGVLAGRVARVGVAFEEQVVPSVPRESWDESMDHVLTPTRVFTRGPR